jgi:hypothetical protein
MAIDSKITFSADFIKVMDFRSILYFYGRFLAQITGQLSGHQFVQSVSSRGQQHVEVGMLLCALWENVQPDKIYLYVFSPLRLTPIVSDYDSH